MFLFPELNNDSVEYKEEFCPMPVLEALRAHRWVISSEEQDAHEMLNVLTETLDEESISAFNQTVPLFEAGKLEVGILLALVPFYPNQKSLPNRSIPIKNDRFFLTLLKFGQGFIEISIKFELWLKYCYQYYD